MTKIVVIGGTGYAGSHILREAASRGHEVVSLSRSAPKDQVPGVRYEHGSVADTDTLTRAINGADVVVCALSPFGGDLTGKFVSTYRSLLAPIAGSGARFVVIGGFSTLRTEAGGTRIIDTGNVPAEYFAGARETADAFELLLAEAPEGLDWLYVSPAAEFGAFAPGERRGSYRKGDDVARFDTEGKSAIGGEDFAIGVVDEIETPTVHRGHISFSYE